jgi:hypothetical protein
MANEPPKRRPRDTVPRPRRLSIRLSDEEARALQAAADHAGMAAGAYLVRSASRTDIGLPELAEGMIIEMHRLSDLLETHASYLEQALRDAASSKDTA